MGLTPVSIEVARRDVVTEPTLMKDDPELFAREVTRAKQQNPLLAERQRLAFETARLRITLERIAGRPASEEIVYEGDLCRIGSHASNDVVVGDPTISRFHCRIVRGRAGWNIVDSGSTNGTRIDNVKILSAELEREIVVNIGDSILRVKPDGQGAAVAIPLVPTFGGLVGGSPRMQRLFDMLERIAPSEIDVLVLGESGSGKELVAAEVVQRSARANGPLIVVDCGALSPSLVESELFGHVRGAFTGAERDREGAFEVADGGTLFLDEIGELPLELQPKLLRALERREIRRVGQTKTKTVDVRVIAATHRDLEREVNRGRFREDLYYRLAKVAVRIPPLRDRVEDIPALVKTFLAAGPEGDVDSTFARAFPADVLEEMQAYEWPGNVRELRNFVERRTVLGDVPPPKRVETEAGGDAAGAEEETGDRLGPIDRTVPFRISKERIVEQFERAYLEPLLEACNGNVSRAAREARMDRMYLHQLAQKYGIKTSVKKKEGTT